MIVPEVGLDPFCRVHNSMLGTYCFRPRGHAGPHQCGKLLRGGVADVLCVLDSGHSEPCRASGGCVEACEQCGGARCDGKPEHVGGHKCYGCARAVLPPLISMWTPGYVTRKGDPPAPPGVVLQAVGTDDRFVGDGMTSFADGFIVVERRGRCEEHVFGETLHGLRCVLEQHHAGKHQVLERSPLGLRHVYFGDWRTACPGRSKTNAECTLVLNHLGDCMFKENA